MLNVVDNGGCAASSVAIDLIDVGVAIDAVARANHQRAERRAPRDAKARLRVRSGRPARARRTSPSAVTSVTDGEPWRDVEVGETSPRFGDRRFDIPTGRRR